MQDDRLRKWLLDRSLVLPDTFDRAVQASLTTSVPVLQVLLDCGALTPLDGHKAREALERQVRFCSQCRRGAEAGDSCPACQGPLEWMDPEAASRIQEMDDLARLTRDEIPREVRMAQVRPDQLFGKYVLLDELGRGGAGIVRKAWDTMLADYVALKFLLDAKAAPDTEHERRERQDRIRDLLREGRAALRMRHPSIVAIRDIGRIDNQVYLAMDFVEGRTMAAHHFAAASRGQISPLHEDPVSTLRTLREVAGALEYAHHLKHPIIHCDLKPGNIMIKRTGEACILDYGLARVLDRSKEDGTSGGTPPYMAPEQYTADGKIGPWTDLYALGAILYEQLSGRPLFKGDRFQVLTQLLHSNPEDPLEVLHRIRRRDQHLPAFRRLWKSGFGRSACAVSPRIRRSGTGASPSWTRNWRKPPPWPRRTRSRSPSGRRRASRSPRPTSPTRSAPRWGRRSRRSGSGSPTGSMKPVPASPTSTRFTDGSGISRSSRLSMTG